MHNGMGYHYSPCSRRVSVAGIGSLIVLAIGGYITWKFAHTISEIIHVTMIATWVIAPLLIAGMFLHSRRANKPVLHTCYCRECETARARLAGSLAGKEPVRVTNLGGKAIENRDTVGEWLDSEGVRADNRVRREGL